VDGVLKSEIDIEALHTKRLTLFGVSNRLRNAEQRAVTVRGFAADILPFIAAGKIRPLVDRVFPFSEVPAAKSYMESNSHLGKIAATYPSAKQQQPAVPVKSDVETPPTDARPSTPASAGQQAAKPVTSVSATRGAGSGSLAAPVKVRLFAHPSRPASYAAGGDQQVVDQSGAVAGYGSFDNYVGKVLGLGRQDVVLKPLKPGAQVIAGTRTAKSDQLADRIRRLDPADLAALAAALPALEALCLDDAP